VFFVAFDSFWRKPHRKKCEFNEFSACETKSDNSAAPGLQYDTLKRFRKPKYKPGKKWSLVAVHSALITYMLRRTRLLNVMSQSALQTIFWSVQVWQLLNKLLRKVYRNFLMWWCTATGCVTCVIRKHTHETWQRIHRSGSPACDKEKTGLST